jgi:hypothetical protein
MVFSQSRFCTLVKAKEEPLFPKSKTYVVSAPKDTQELVVRFY